MSALGQKQTCAAQKVMSALPPKADICECLAIERERGSVEAIYCGRSLLCRPTYWRGSAGSSDVISKTCRLTEPQKYKRIAERGLQRSF